MGRSLSSIRSLAVGKKPKPLNSSMNADYGKEALQDNTESLPEQVLNEKEEQGTSPFDVERGTTHHNNNDEEEIVFDVIDEDVIDEDVIDEDDESSRKRSPLCADAPLFAEATT